jgi:NAD(P)-dependent dehydrogenase (short-subunit alcohol dehydrogenase family)
MEDVDKLATTALQATNGIDVLVNNAGATVPQLAPANTPPEKLDNPVSGE